MLACVARAGLTVRELKLDALHPTAAGHKLFADRAIGELADIGFVDRR